VLFDRQVELSELRGSRRLGAGVGPRRALPPHLGRPPLLLGGRIHRRAPRARRGGSADSAGVAGGDVRGSMSRWIASPDLVCARFVQREGLHAAAPVAL